MSPPPASSASPAPPPVRRLTPADLSACLDLAEDRGWEREDRTWRLLLTAGQGWGVDAPDRPGALIGTYVRMAYAGPGDAGEGFGYLGMVLVARRYGRQGLGHRLVRHALAESRATGLILTATEQGRPLYEELGFKHLAHSSVLRGTFTGELAPSPTHPGVRIRAAAAADLRAVIALDATAFGADRTELLARLPAFADRFLVAERTEAAGGMAGGPVGSTALVGFAACRPAPSATVLGPVVAEDLGTAQALITELATGTSGPVRFDADSRHHELVRWLRGNGLAVDDVFSLMTHNLPDLPGDLRHRFAPYARALG